MRDKFSFNTYLFILIVCFGLPLMTSCKHDAAKPISSQKTTKSQADSSPLLVQLERLPVKGVTSKTPTLILLHGLGSNEKDLYSLAKHFGPDWLILCARGPISLGQERYSWFPLQHNGSEWTYNFQDVIQSRDIVVQYLEEITDKYGIDPANTCLGGFSQGAILSLATGLKYPEKIKGIVSLSGHLYPEVKSDLAEMSALSKTKIFVSHGIQDRVLPSEPMRQAVKYLKEKGLDVSDNWYDMQHNISSENIRDLLLWLENDFPD